MSILRNAEVVTMCANVNMFFLSDNFIKHVWFRFSTREFPLIMKDDICRIHFFSSLVKIKPTILMKSYHVGP